MGIGVFAVLEKSPTYEMLDWIVVLVLYTLLIAFATFLFKKIKNYVPKNKKSDSTIKNMLLESTQQFAQGSFCVALMIRQIQIELILRLKN